MLALIQLNSIPRQMFSKRLSGTSTVITSHFFNKFSQPQVKIIYLSWQILISRRKHTHTYETDSDDTQRYYFYRPRFLSHWQQTTLSSSLLGTESHSFSYSFLSNYPNPSYPLHSSHSLTGSAPRTVTPGHAWTTIVCWWRIKSRSELQQDDEQANTSSQHSWMLGARMVSACSQSDDCRRAREVTDESPCLG